MSDAGYFIRTGDTCTPRPMAASLWSTDQMHGVALSGLLAKGIEERLNSLGRESMVPARYRADLFRAARMVPTWITTDVVRQGPRIVVIDAEVHQMLPRRDDPEGGLVDQVMARGSATFLEPGEQPTGAVWHSPERSQPPSADVAPESTEMRLPLWCSDEPWSTEFGAHQNAGRHGTWQTPVPTIQGEPMSPFVTAAAVADTASMITNWGPAGVEWINSDVVMTMCRRPLTGELGIRALDHLSADGVAVGVAELFDRGGTFGTVTVTALGNTRRTVSFEKDPHHVTDAGFGRA